MRQTFDRETMGGTSAAAPRRQLSNALAALAAMVLTASCAAGGEAELELDPDLGRSQHAALEESAQADPAENPALVPLLEGLGYCAANASCDQCTACMVTGFAEISAACRAGTLCDSHPDLCAAIPAGVLCPAAALVVGDRMVPRLLCATEEVCEAPTCMFDRDCDRGESCEEVGETFRCCNDDGECR